MKRLPPHSIPPLSDSGLHRIERGVFAALDAPAPLVSPVPPRSGRRRFVALSFAAAAALVVVGVRQGRRGETPSRAQITTTTSGSRIAITGAALEIAPESAVSFGAGKDGAMVVVLDRGAVTCEVAPRTNRAPFIVEAGMTRVTVIGTRFTVRRLGEHAAVSVEHGLVEVADTDMTELVHAGESFRPGEPIIGAPLATEAPAPVVVAPVVVAPVVVAPVVVAPVGPTTVAVAGKPVARAELPPRTLHAHERRVAVASADDVVAAPATPAVVASVAAAPANDAPVVEKPAAPPEPDARRASSQVLFELAAQLEVRDPTTALSIYGQLAAADDAWAASALFAAARLEAERHRAPGARELSEAYLRRFPRGPNADDARALLDALR
ncbi:MAG: iron dicitrate transport regulator FecR [Myxococcales bacterium]|nr:iron dicitrate transport regulator FecR [Myxococcales bacterium]